jgi:hypothetical protein
VLILYYIIIIIKKNSHNTWWVSWEKEKYPTKFADFRLTNPLPEGKKYHSKWSAEQQQMSLTRPEGQDV